MIRGTTGEHRLEGARVGGPLLPLLQVAGIELPVLAAVVEPGGSGLASIPSRSKPGAGAAPSSEWKKEVEAIRAQSVKDLFDLVRKAAEAEPPHLAKVDLYLRRIIERDPGHAEARRLLGYAPHDGGWARPFAVDQLEKGFVAHPVYGWVPDEAYRTGRVAVLKGFLDRPRIYRTERMFAAAEEAARANLRDEIAALGGGTIPSP